MKAAVVSEIGNRIRMEDTFFLDLNFAGRGWIFGGVYDGHGGGYAAQYASRHLHDEFLRRLDSGLLPDYAFEKAYHAISDALKDQNSGTTAANFLLRGRELFTANAGDARILAVSRTSCRQLSVDHRLDNPEERKRIVEKGGVVQYPYAMKGGKGLMPTRTLGDEFFKTIGIIATPYTGRYSLAPDDLTLLAGCDGLFDVMENEAVADLARKTPDPQELVGLLKTEVFEGRLGWDNLTVIAVNLKE